MKADAKTIQIFLPSGDPSGIRVAEITTRIVRVVDVPRKLLGDFQSRPEASAVGLYLLLSGDPEAGKPRVYIGQTENVGQRLQEHHKQKDFWNRSVVVTSRAQSLTQTHIRFLEWYCIRQAKETGRYVVENGKDEKRPHAPEAMEAEILEVFETARTLLATLGYPVFEPLAHGAGAQSQEVFHLVGRGAKATGLYTAEGFVVLKGSTAAVDNVPSIQGTADAAFRERLKTSGILAMEGEKLVFTSDHLFSAPSTAAVAVLGRTSNGWTEWKAANGKTLDELKRKNQSPAAAPQ